MKNNISGIKGLGVALVTPFDDYGEVDLTDLGMLVDYVVNNGADYIVGLGTTAETPTLTCDERLSIMQRIYDKIAGRVPLIMGMGGYWTAQWEERITELLPDYVDAILSVTPYYNRPSQEGLYQHYKALSKVARKPIILYNVPSRTGVNLEPATVFRLANDFENIIGIKEASGNLNQVVKLLKGRPEGFKVISGDDALTLPFIALGADGVISVAANAFPRICSEMVEAATKGKTEKAAALNLRLAEAVEAMFEEGNPSGIKAALAAKKMITNVLRLPLVKASDGLCDRWHDIIARNDL